MKAEQRRQRTQLVEFDRIQKVGKDEKASHWQGERGMYLIEKLPPVAGKRLSPIARIYLGHNYLSGMFPTRRRGEYSADRKEVDGEKVYLTIRFTGDTATIFERRPN